MQVERMEQRRGRRPQRELTPRTLLQILYFSVRYTSSNDLFSYAASCAFGFLLSFLPVVMMILTILVRFLHAEGKVVSEFLQVYPLVSSTVNLENVINSLRQIRTLTNFEVIVSITIVWMARRFFISLTRSLRRIFRHSDRQQKGFILVFSFAAEALLTIIISALIFLLIVFRSLVRLPILDELTLAYPALMESFTDLIAGTFPFILLFIGCVLVYKFMSRTRPTLMQCIFPALLCTFSFWGFRKLMKLFINVNRYNTVYGVLSNAIVLLLEVYFFFIIFLFFAQMLFVNQFFDSLILGELYCLPGRNETKLKASLKRLLFIRPDSLLEQEENTLCLKKGSYVYRQGEEGCYSYYVTEGALMLSRQNSLRYLEEGSFFGEDVFLSRQGRSEDALAISDCVLIKVGKELFFSMLKRNPALAQRSLFRMYPRVEEGQ
ncbi:MAG: YihY/virulence factor BrkB family protein [Treponema sp.]|nr:YihY/virulence factor BrkB family protein [Treponema sp.]